MKKAKKVEISLYDLHQIDKKAKKMYKPNQVIDIQVESNKVPKLKINIKKPEEQSFSLP